MCIYADREFANRRSATVLVARPVVIGSPSNRVYSSAREQLSISAIIEMAAAAGSVAAVGGITPAPRYDPLNST